VFSSLQHFFELILHIIAQHIQYRVKPRNPSIFTGAILDLTRSRSELVLENAFLRQQLIVLNRHVIRPACKPRERALLVMLASGLRSWKQALTIVQPDTLLRWHRDLYRWLWKRKSRKKNPWVLPPLSEETARLIRRMARDNRTWAANRIHGELLKLGLRAAKSTIQGCIKYSRDPGSSQQRWRTFPGQSVRTGIHNHASEIWACDILQTYDGFFRALFVFIIIELRNRRVVHFGATRHPTDKWLAQQLREATPFGEGPRFLIRDNDRKYGSSFRRVAIGAGTEVLRTPYRAPKANAICERFLGSLQRECLDHFIVFSDQHIYRIVKQYVHYFNYARPHQGISQQIPCRPRCLNKSDTDGQVVSRPVLGGLHHDYQRRAA
jgi:putative transposase